MSAEPLLEDGDEDEDDAPGDVMDEAAARFLRSAWKSSPGIVLSVAFHAAILAVLPLIVFSEKIRELVGIPVTIGVDAVRIDPERPYKPVAGGPPSSSGEGLDEKPVFFPEAVAAERNEAKALADMKDENTLDGEQRALLEHFASDVQSGGFAGRLNHGPPGTNFVMGVGGGSGRGGARTGSGRISASGRQNLVAKGGGSKYTEAAVELGLSWLARHQSADGSWSSKPPCKKCPGSEGSVEVASTSLALLAFVTAGYGPDTQVTITDRVTGRALSYGDTVRAAINFLRSQQQRSECICASPSVYGGLYEHAFATMALCETSRITKSADVRERAERALRYLVGVQDGTGGWTDSSVTGACVQALRSARNAEIKIPQRCLDGVEKWFRRAGNTKTGETGYQDHTDCRPSLTAIGLYARRFLNPGPTLSDAFMAHAAKKVAEGVGNGEFNGDSYLWYYAMLSLFEYEGPTGTSFRPVNLAVTTALVKAQHRDAKKCDEGSWDGLGFMSGYGPALPTALSVLTLETYYRYVDATPPHGDRRPEAPGAPAATKSVDAPR